MNNTRILTKTFLIIMVLVAGLYAIIYIVPASASGETQPPFDHSDCQYPNRTTNPPNGCDNSDPCDAAQTKFGSGDCIDTSQGSTETPEGPKGSAPYSDPNRDYYDQYGNRYDYRGTLKQSAPKEDAPITCTGN